MELLYNGDLRFLKKEKLMKMDPGIICFQHCGPKMFSFSLPEACPACQAEISHHRQDFSLLPFRVPYPFVRASQHPCSVLIRPTSGDFLNDYNNSMDLHIGVTTSSGMIVEFDRHGLRKHRNSFWDQCLLLGEVSSAWTELWDKTLGWVSRQAQWSPENYHEEKLNCYSFVLTFLKNVGCGPLSSAALNRTVFCEKFIVPRTTSAGKYISLYRKLKEKGVYVHKGKRLNNL